MGRERWITCVRVIPAPAKPIFDLLADPSKHPIIDGSGSVRRSLGPKQRLELGARFGMAMRLGVPYRIINSVIEFEENKLIAWRHFVGHVWRWRLEPANDGTLVTETFDWSTSRWPRALELLGYPERNRRGMDRTLDRLELLFTGGGLPPR